MGDVLWIEPVVRAYSARFSKVIVYTKFAALFEDYPLNNVVFKENIHWLVKVWLRFEQILGLSWLGLNLENSYEKQPKKHLLEVYTSLAGLPFKREYPWLQWAVSPTTQRIDENYIVVHLSAKSAAHNFRNVHGVEWSKVFNFLEDNGYTIVEIGDSPGIYPEKYRKTNFKELVNVISNAQFFIGIDSGPSHIAASLGTPALLFFGAINPAFRHFQDHFKGIIMQNSCEFAGCFHDNSRAHLQHTCKLVGDLGNPKCCTFSTNEVIEHIVKLEAIYLDK